MSVNHLLLPITNDELISLLETPAKIRQLVDERDSEIVRIGTDGLAIVALTATSREDPLAFIRAGASDTVSGWIGKCSEEDNVCEVDMGYGPASYYKNSFLSIVARGLESITTDAFAEQCDVDWLDENNVYPSGWRKNGRKEELLRSFCAYRSCIIDAAASGLHLLVWCA